MKEEMVLISRSLFVVYIPVITVAISAAFFLSQQDSKETRLLRPLGFLTVVFLIMMSLQTILKRENFHPDPYEWKKYALEDASNDAFFGKVSVFGKGMMLTSSDLHLIQLRTRRAVLLDGGQLDLLPYTCEAGPAMELILREVYGIDFFNPPDQAKRMASLRVDSNQTLWEKRTQLEWIRIAKKFGITEILTFSSWRLQLPVAEQNHSYTLYTIPEL